MLKKFLSLIKKSQTIVITGHVSPDADSLGSIIALTHALKKLKKTVIPLCEESPEQKYHHLGCNILEKKVVGIPDLLIIVDCYQQKRLGEVGKKLFKSSQNILIIDHHPAPKHLIDNHYIRPQAVSTTYLVGQLISELNTKLTKEIALPLYTGIMIDSNSFRSPSVDADTHRMVAKLLETGIDPATTFNKIYGGKNFKHIKFLGEVLLSAKTRGKIAWIKIDRKILDKYKVSPRDTLYFVNNLLIIDDISIVCVFRQEGNQIKVGLRSNKTDVGKLASILGGGGHRHIAAALINGTMDNVIKNTISIFDKLVS